MLCRCAERLAAVWAPQVSLDQVTWKGKGKMKSSAKPSEEQSISSSSGASDCPSSRPGQRCVTTQDNGTEENGHRLMGDLGKAPQPPCRPAGGLSVSGWCFNSPWPFPLTTTYSCVMTVLFFIWGEDGSHLLIQEISTANCFLGMGYCWCPRRLFPFS